MTAGASRDESRSAGALALAACVWLLGMELLGLVEALAYLAPPLALVLLLLLGRFPGEEAVARRLRMAGGPRPRARSIRLTQPLVHTALPRGGALLSTALAGRGPPLPALTASFERKELK